MAVTDKFRQLFTTFSMNHLDIPGNLKIVKTPINTCTTLRNDDIIVTSLKNTSFHKKKKNSEFIPPLLWPPNSPDLNPVDCSVWGILQEKVYIKRRVTDLDDLKHHIRTEWTKLDHVFIAATVHQWRRRLSACVKASDGHFEQFLISTLCLQ